MAEAAKPKELRVGSQVHLVHANGKHFPAKVTKLGPGKKIDLEADLGGEEPLVITGSPLDESGKKPDSWHPVESEVADATPPEGGTPAK